MRSPVGIRRVVVVVLDGLRPDTIEGYGLANLQRLSAGGAWTRQARTVAPSVTAAAMASLLTGVTPSRHGVRSDRFHIPRAATTLSPVPRVLAASHYPTAAFLAEIPSLFKGIAGRIANQLGVVDTRFSGTNAETILRSARHTLAVQRRGLIVLHWPDADRAGHDHGWLSAPYEAAARSMDKALGVLAALTEVPRDAGTLLVALSDHGGGGATPKDHDSDAPLDRTIFITLPGGSVSPGRLLGPTSILDVPPTILWSLGVAPPANYDGVPLVAAFRHGPEPRPRLELKPEPEQTVAA